jgi:CubicO group peptidase (beta-lactamase class C family)
MHPVKIVAEALFATNPAPALSIAVARAKGDVWATAFGKANLEFDIDATPNHLFRLGSVSKVLTSTVAARLVARGLLDLDAPISAWLDLPEQHRGTTMRQLLTHQGGIRHYVARDLDPSSPGGTVYCRSYPTNADILAIFIDDPLIAPPGTRVSYTTFGYTLASLVMEAASRQAFPDLVKTELGQGFGLSSLVEDDLLAIIPLRTSGYVTASDMALFFSHREGPKPQLEGDFGNVPSCNPAFSWAGAGFLMTPSDAARFGAALIGSPHSRVTAAERDLLFTPLTEAQIGSPPLGLGWRLDTDSKGRRRWHHAGATPGGRFCLVVYPDLALSIALASNVMTAPGNVLQPASDLADAFA